MPAHSPLKWALTRPASLYLGRRSYGIYLYHYPIFKAAEALRVPGSPVNFLLVAALEIAVTLAVAELSWRLIEQPAMRFKKRFAWRKPGEDSGAQTA
jgi:peptidoglycan/LPS O-acetylase OafA/YrhL